MNNETRSLLILQVVFGTILLLLGMFLINPLVAYSNNLPMLFVAVAILCFKDGLIQLASSFITIMKIRKEGKDE